MSPQKPSEAVLNAAAAPLDNLCGRYRRSHWKPIPPVWRPGNFSPLRSAGVNRVSVGVQALNDEALKFSGPPTLRGAEALADAFKLAAEDIRAGFVRHDLRPAGSDLCTDWRALSSAQALPHAQGHMSLYQLTIEPQDPVFRSSCRRQAGGAGGGRGTGLVRCDPRAYGRSRIARLRSLQSRSAPGQECRHNLLYWRYGDYAGLGPGAHSRLTLLRMEPAWAGPWSARRKPGLIRGRAQSRRMDWQTKRTSSDWTEQFARMSICSWVSGSTEGIRPQASPNHRRRPAGACPDLRRWKAERLDARRAGRLMAISGRAAGVERGEELSGGAINPHLLRPPFHAQLATAGVHRSEHEACSRLIGSLLSRGRGVSGNSLSPPLRVILANARDPRRGAAPPHEDLHGCLRRLRKDAGLD